MLLYLELFVFLLVILLAAQIFTNALEHLGQWLKISEGVTGSLFAAVGTALPEAIMPILAIMNSTQNPVVKHEISIGAILGAPLMLSTVACGLMGCAAIAKRGLIGFLKPEPSGLKRDIDFFLVCYFLATIALFLPHHFGSINLRSILSVILLGLYFIYSMMTLKASKNLVQAGHSTTAEHPMYLTHIGFKVNFVTIILQLFIGLIILIVGANQFIESIANLANSLKISALFLSLLMIPIATELPEKINSILWIKRKKDTLAFGNITGAMVFQGALLPAVGIMLTNWQANTDIILSVTITLLATLWLRYWATRKQPIQVWHLFGNGLLYVVYLFIAFNFSMR